MVISMNKSMIIALLGLFLFGCATETPIVDQTVPEPLVQAVEPVVPEAPVEPTAEEPKTAPAEAVTGAASVPSAAVETNVYPDPFDGKTLNTKKYTQKIFGPGSITQDDALISSGEGKRVIVWNIFHTNEEIDFTKNFEITVDVSLEQHVETGDAMAIVSLEEKDKVKGEMPTLHFCELMSGPSHLSNLRSKGSGHGIKVPKLTGKMQVSYDVVRNQFKCKFGDETRWFGEVEDTKAMDFRKYVVVLRGGMHIPSSYEEGKTSGDFKATFDNLNIVR